MGRPFDLLSFPIPESVTGPRVFVRRWQAGDGQALFAAIDAARNRLAPWMEWTVHQAVPADSEAYCRRMSEAWDRREVLALGIWSRETGALLGGSGLHDVNWQIPAAEIGYWASEAGLGHGYIEEAVRLQIHLAFDVLGVQRLRLTCDPRNTRSRRIPERIGFTLEGVMRNHALTPDGSLRDTMLFSLIPTDPAADQHSFVVS